MKKTVAIVLCVVVCLSLCACGSAEEELQKGIWCRERTVMGSKMLQEFEFEADGSFVCTLRINGTFKGLEMGTYKMGDSQIVLTYESGDEIKMDYTYESGKLTLKIGEDTLYNREAKA